MDILFSYNFVIVTLGISILAITSSIIGCFSLYKGQSLIGDTIGHSTFPGVLLAFAIFQTRNPIILTLGAIIFGFFAFLTINIIVNNSKIKLDSALAIVLSGFFGLGVVLKTFIQKNQNLIGESQSGLKNYIFGSSAFITKSDVIVLLVSSVVILSILFLFRKEIIISIFDKDFATSKGINISLVDFVLIFIMIWVISLGIKSVGAVLISSFLIIPCICANQHSKKLSQVLIISVFVSLFSSIIGTYISATSKGISTGPIIIVIMSMFTIISMFVGKNGIYKRGEK